MKQYFIVRLIFVFGLLSLSTQLSAQEYAYEFGAVSNGELEATVYPKAPDADAVVISDYAYRTIVVGTYHPWTRVKIPRIPNRGYARDRVYGLFPYVIETTHQQKIKIFNKKGLRKATLKIPFYNKRAPLKEEVIDNISALLHHLNNGKIETTKFDDKNIKIENITDSISTVVISFSSAKVGDVVEFRYKRTSPLYLGMKNWNFQTDIPVMAALLEVFLYDAFQYNMIQKGVYPIKKQSVIENPKLNDLKQKVFNGRSAVRTIFITRNLPAWKKNSKFIWNEKDHISGIDFELRSTKFLGYVPYANTWKDVEERIENETKFNKLVYGKDYFKKEVKALIQDKKTQKEKLEAIYGLIKEKIKWNGRYALYGNVKEAVKKGVGNNAAINSALIRALKTADIYVYPVLISPRHMGSFPKDKPTFDKLKTFIVCASLPDGMSYYMDGSAYLGGVNAIPTNLMAYKARTFVRSYDLLEGQSNATVNISDAGNYELIQNIEITPKSSTLLIGKMTTQYKTLSAYTFKKRFHRAGRKEELVVETEQAKDIKITNYNLKGNKLISNHIIEDFDFSRNIKEKNKATIIFNPLLVADRMRDYTISEKRVLPIELDALTKRTITISIDIPEDYDVKNLPKSIQHQMPDQSVVFSYKVQKENQKITIRTHFEINRVKIEPKNFNEFRDIVKSIKTATNQVVEFIKK